jgi:CHAT domain-containing protein/Tfp pilus assembly protein PilF
MTDRSRPDSALNGPHRQFTSRSLAKLLCFFFSALAVAGSENTWGDTLGRPTQQPPQAARDGGSKADDKKETRLLEPGQPIKRELAGDNSHTYQIMLAEGDCLSLVVEQHGIDVVVKVVGPDGKHILESDSEPRKQGEERVSLVAEVAGSYRLSIQSAQRVAPAGRYGIGVAELRAATERDRRLHEARKLSAESFRLYNAGKYDEALPLVEHAVDIRRDELGPEHLDVAHSLRILAIIYRAKGETAKAEPIQQLVLSIREKRLGPEHPLVAQTLHNLANLYDDGGNSAQAEQLYQRGLEIGEKTLGPEHPQVATSLNSLGIIYRDKGDYVRAEQYFQRALAIREKMLEPGHPFIGTSLNNLAAIYHDKGDYLKAEPLYHRALALQEKTQGAEHPAFAMYLDNLAILYSDKGDYAKAEPFYRRALAVLEKVLGLEHLSVGQTLNGLGILHRVIGDYAKAEQFHQRALAIREKALGPENHSVANSTRDLAAVYRDKGEYARAEPLFQRALAILENALGPEHPYVVTFLDDLAVLYAAKGDFAQAITAQARATSVGERNLALNLSIGSERQKLAYLALFSEQTDFTLSLHSQALPQDPQALDLAFTTLLRRKGRGLDVMANTIAALRSRAAPDDQALFDRLAEARSQLAALTLKELGTDKPEAYRARLKPLADKVEELESSLSARSPEFRAQAQPIRLAAVQAALPADSALIEFAIYTPRDMRNNKNKMPPRYLAYLLAAQGEPRWIDLGEAAPIDRAITAWQRALRNPRRSDVKRLARAVDEKVMRPVLALAQSGMGQTRRLLIAPDGLLNLIPFAALVDRQGRYLVERYSISYLTSGRDLLRSPIDRPVEQKAVIVANPDYGRIAVAGTSGGRDVGLPPGPAKSSGQQLNLSQAYFPPLAGAAGEAQALKAILPQATVLTREQATEAALKGLHSPRILHVATHGFFLRDQELELVGMRDRGAVTVRSVGFADQPIENPLLRSGLALAGVNRRRGSADQGEDGVLTALEAVGLDLWGTKLVVLSACDTGVGEVKNGEGVFGLRRALALAGAETQVMSLWPVSDLGTRELMVEYYKGLQRGEGRGDGLRRVQLEMLKRKARQHPFYWASFIQAGEWASLASRPAR